MTDSEFHNKILNILNKHDPIEFYLTGGIYPSDEYSTEATDILSYLQIHYASLDAVGIRKLVYKVFKTSFDQSALMNDDKYKAIAEELLKTLFK